MWDEIRKTDAVVASVRRSLQQVKYQQRLIEVKRVLRAKDASGAAPSASMIAQRAVFYMADPDAGVTPEMVARAVAELLK